MIRTTRSSRAIATGLALVVLGGSLAVTATVAPSSPAAAATVTIGTIQAQMADHRGQDNGTTNNCIRYAPPGTAVSSAFVSSPGEALTAHGYRTTCPAELSTVNQSAVGFRPSSVTTVEDGQAFLIGRMVHYNNPIQANDRYFTGAMRTALGGFVAPNTLTFDWRIDETPNSGGGTCCNDVISFTNQISDLPLDQGGLRFRLVLRGFLPIANASSCPAAPSGTPVNEFTTVEGAQTHACLYATVVQTRQLTVIKTIASGPARTFGFTSTSTLAGSPWSNGSFTLGSGGTRTSELTSGDTVSVTETDPGDDRWTLTGLTCTQIGTGGVPQPVPGSTFNLAARRVVLANVPPPPLVSEPGITCRFTNSYTPRTTLTLVKQVSSGSADPSLWTLTATGSAAPPPEGTQISGRSGAATVTAQRVPSGTYTLTETGTGAAATGYVQDGDWLCRTGSGATVPVTAGTVTLSDHAVSSVGSAVTCTVTNRLAAGSLRIVKVVDAPPGAYTGGTTKTFAGTYDCGPGSSGAFSTLTTGAPVVIAGIPAGRICTVTEVPPTGGLANDSYAWGQARFSEQPVTIADQGVSQVTITNPVEQRFGTFSITKEVSGPGGYTGGTDRVFPVTYTCTLGGVSTPGSLDVTLGQSVSPATPIPRGSLCSFGETLTAQPGDFSDASYAWSGATVTPPSVTIGDGTTAAVTLTNTYVREFGSLVIAKVVTGAGYLGGTDENFTVGYDCGTGFAGSVTVAAGDSTSIPGLPARLACVVQELPPDSALLSPAYTWGTPTWSPGAVAAVPAGGSTTLTVTNPTTAIFGQLRVTKEITGETQGVTTDAVFLVEAVCSNGEEYEFELAVGETGSTPAIPVGTSCTITEDPPSGGLVDSSYAWGPTPGSQDVTITASGQVVAVTVTNNVVRVTGQLTITKAPITPAGIVDGDRTFDIDFSCVYGSDPPIAGAVALTAGSTATTPPVLLGSTCTVTEDPAELTVPPSDDPSWVWLPVTYEPSQQVVVASSTTPVAVTVVNSIDQITGAFNVTKAVVGAGKAGGYTPGSTFDFDITCDDGFSTDVALADGASFPAGPLAAFVSCTVTELAVPPPASPAYGWDPVQFTVNGVPAGSGTSVTFEIPDTGVPVQVNVSNPITPRLGSVIVEKAVTGETAGLAPDAPPFTINLACGPGLGYQLAVPAGGSVTQDAVPVGSVCTATETAPAGGLVDASYAWGPPTFEPADATVTVALGAPATIRVVDPILRVTAPLHLVKTYVGPQGVIDPGRTYPISWSCTYAGTVVASGDELIVADPSGTTVADAVPVTSVCTATEGDLGAPSIDPAFRWEPPVITGTTIAAPGPNTITVVNTLTRDNGRVIVRKIVTGATEGYIGGTGENFTLHGQCRVADHPEIPVRTRDGTIANGGVVVVEPVSIGWTCFGYEDTPSQDLLRDASYAWAPAILDPPGDFVLTREEPEQEFIAENPIVRVTASFSIVKEVVDPNGVVDPAASFTGTYSCRYGSDPPVEGDWVITPADDNSFTVLDLYLGSVCAVTEDDPGSTGLTDGSWAWSPPAIGDPAEVVAGDTASVTVTNTVERLWSGLRITKAIVDPAGGVLPGARFGGVWTCVQGGNSYSARFSVAVGDTIIFSPADERVPATAVCSITEDTLLEAGLRDGSFAWVEPVYEPAEVTLVASETATLGVTNRVVRVYSDVSIRKVVTGPAEGLVPEDREFTGTISCRYGAADPIETTWAATLATPALGAGVLVESVCTATEDQPGFGGQPVEGDSSYIWRPAIISDPVRITPPSEPTPPIVVTNPTARLFGTFRVTKATEGATEGIVDPAASYVMDYECTPGTGAPITGQLEVPVGETRTVGPEQQIPTGSECTLSEPLASMPELVDDAWTWDDPTFEVDGDLVPGGGRTLSFTIPVPQENEPEPTVAIRVTNTVDRTSGAWSVVKSSDPPSGAIVEPGSAITYSLTVSSTGAVPVHDVVVGDDLSRVLPFASVVETSIDAPAGTTAVLDPEAEQLVWTVGTVPPESSLTLSYRVQVRPDAVGITIRNQVSGAGDVPPDDCGPAANRTAGHTGPCSTHHQTPRGPTMTKELTGDPVFDTGSELWTVGYRIVVTNADADAAAPYSLRDRLEFAPGFEVRSAAVTSAPAGVELARPPWDGQTSLAITTGASVPPASTHTYELVVTVFVPATTSTELLDCSTGTTGVGFFNSARLRSRGTESTDTACAPARVVLEVDKRWVIGGTEYADGLQPAEFTAELTLDGAVVRWDTPYDRYLPGATVEIGEDVEVPANCENTASGLGPVSLTSARTSRTVTNVVSCQATPDPPPRVPSTGFRMLGLLAWGAVILAAGVLLTISVRRRPRTATHRGEG